MENLDLYNKVRVVPKEAQKEIKGGRLSGMTDINPMWRIKILTEMFGTCGIGWYYETTKQWLETGADGEILAFTNIELFIKQDGEWSKPICGNGGSKMVSKEAKGFFNSDEAYKMSGTDALSVACKQLGIGADIYFGKDTTKYSAPTQATTPQKKDNKEALALFQAEIKRTGKSADYFLKQAQSESWETVTIPQIEHFIGMLNKLPDKIKE